MCILHYYLRFTQFFIYLPFANAKPQTSHLNGLSPEWSLLWDQSEEYRENVPSQTLQWNGFSAWFWLFCLPPEIENIDKTLVFLKGPVLQKSDKLEVYLWKIYQSTRCEICLWYYNIYFFLYIQKRNIYIYGMWNHKMK